MVRSDLDNHSSPAPQNRMSPLRSVTLVEQIVEAIMKAAGEGRFRPGDRVVEAEVARELGVSRVPVREALRLLESQGIVVNVPHSGMRLMEVDARHLRQILVVRSGLERLAAPPAAAVLRTNPVAQRSLDVHLIDMAEAARCGSSFDLARADTAFHRTICELADNQVLLQLWDTLARRLTIIFGLAARSMDLDQIYRSHVTLLEVLLRGETDEISLTFNQHIMEALDLLHVSDDRSA